MQLTKHGIPCNVPLGYRPNVKVKAVNHKKMIAQSPYKHYVELTRFVDGLEETQHVPAGTKWHKQALREGYQVVSRWTIN